MAHAAVAQVSSSSQARTKRSRSQSTTLEPEMLSRARQHLETLRPYVHLDRPEGLSREARTAMDELMRWFCTKDGMSLAQLRMYHRHAAINPRQAEALTSIMKSAFALKHGKK
jgi:hypothetical protein